MMRQGVNSILVPVDHSPHSERAFRWACQIARQSKAQLHALHVIEVPLSLSLEADITEHVEYAENLLSRYEHIARQEKYRGLEADCVRARSVGAAIVREADIKQAEMLVVGIPYQRSMGQCSMGDAASYIFQHAPCQVLLWRDTAPVAALSGV